MNGQALFGKRIRAIREAASVSRELVAEKADINVNYLGEIERGEKWPSLEIIEQLAKALSVSPPEFFEFEAEETEPSLLLAKVQRVLADRSTEQLQQALRILKALFQVSTAGHRSVLRLSRQLFGRTTPEPFSRLSKPSTVSLQVRGHCPHNTAANKPAILMFSD